MMIDVVIGITVLQCDSMNMGLVNRVITRKKTNANHKKTLMQMSTFSLLEVIHSILTKVLACVRIDSFVKNNEAFLLCRRQQHFAQIFHHLFRN